MIQDAMIATFATPLFVFITGASGSGKTALLEEFKRKSNSELIAIYHFDDVGVPSFEEMIRDYGSVEAWQEAMLALWITKLAKIKDKTLIVLEGSFNPDFLITQLQKHSMNNYLLLCVVCEQKEREQRLLHRGNKELITQDMENFAQLLEQKTRYYQGIVIDTTQKTREELVKELEGFITKKARAML